MTRLLELSKLFPTVRLCWRAAIALPLISLSIGALAQDVNVTTRTDPIALPGPAAPITMGGAARSGASTDPSATRVIGPMELRNPGGVGNPGSTFDPRAPAMYGEPVIVLPPYVPSEFERFVNAQTLRSPEQPIRRFGSTLLTDAVNSGGQETLPAVPASYIVKPGDEIALAVWGSVDAELRLTVDRSGIITVPRVGAINVGGVRYSDLKEVVSRRVGQAFNNFQLSVSIGQVRPIRVFVSGYAQRPGSITVSGLASVLHAVMRAGGPSAAGSFRDIRLSRGGHQIGTYDLYDLLLNGNRGADELVQADDIIFIGPIGPQVAVTGSVNQEGIFELKPGEALEDALRMAGGFAAVADTRRVTIERLADRATGHVTELDLPRHARDALATGDLISAISLVAAESPSDRQNMRVRIDGEVVRPGDYVMPPGSTINDAVRIAGGLTPAAFPYGAEFTRLSVRKTQQANFDRALRELESNMARNDATQHVGTTEEAEARRLSQASNERLVATLRELKPSGRIVLEINPSDRALPDFSLEDGDTLRIPRKGTSVGVFGSVFNGGSFFFKPNRRPPDYLHLAGGPTRGADKKSMFLIHANGSVVSAQQGASFWHSGNEFDDEAVEPGDTIFVPEELNKSTFIQDAKDWTQILYQFGLGVAGIKSLGL